MNSNDSPSPAGKPGEFAANVALGVVGALIGGVAGHVLFIWIAKQGFYAPFVPGGLVGFTASLFLKRRSTIALAVVCGVLALCAGVVSEWRAFPFIKDQSFGYFVAHIQDLRPLTLIFLCLGGFLGFWIPFRTGSK